MREGARERGVRRFALSKSVSRANILGKGQDAVLLAGNEIHECAFDRNRNSSLPKRAEAEKHKVHRSGNDHS